MLRAAVVGAALSVLLAGCASQGSGSGQGGTAGPIEVAAADGSCAVTTTTAATGNVTFEITNKGSKVTEFYLYAEGDRIMGEVENIAPGLNRRLIVSVPTSGKYQTACKPGMVGRGIRGDFTVTGGAAQPPGVDAQKNQATTSYGQYVASNSAALETDTAMFVEAVKAGRVDQAKALYAPTRVFYERIEPVAEKFGDLDPAVDAREADLESGQQFTGFHRLEKDLWVTGLHSDSPMIAGRLLEDVKSLTAKIKTLQLTTLDLANGAKSLLDEVATHKITGEEETFSHTDLSDFQANVEGSKAAIAALRVILESRDPGTVAALDKQFANVQALLDKTRVGDTFKYYNQLSQGEIRAFASAVDALAEPLSKVAQSVAT